MADTQQEKKVYQDILSQLPHGTWRGIVFPITERSVRFAHEGSDHQIIYRNGVAVEMTGAGPVVITYKIPFREGIRKGPYHSLFSSVLLQFWRAYYEDKTPGDLYDPVYGNLRCVPQTWDETLDVNKRDGVDVSVSFKRDTSLDGADDSPDSTLSSLTSDVTRLDDEIDSVEWPQAVNSPHTKGDLFSVISGVIQQGNFTFSKVRARVAEVAMRMHEVEDSAAEAENNITNGAGLLRQDARRFRLRAMRMQVAPPQSRASTLVRRATNIDSTVPAEAQRAGMTVQDFLFLNPDLARSMVIKAGQTFWVRKKGT